MNTSLSMPRRMSLRARSLALLVRELRDSGRWWLIPMALVLVASSVLLVVVTAVEYVAPFVYTIF